MYIGARLLRDHPKVKIKHALTLTLIRLRQPYDRNQPGAAMEAIRFRPVAK
jgi:hypothetical protein